MLVALQLLTRPGHATTQRTKAHLLCLENVVATLVNSSLAATVRNPPEEEALGGKQVFWKEFEVNPLPYYCYNLAPNLEQELEFKRWQKNRKQHGGKREKRPQNEHS